MDLTNFYSALEIMGLGMAGIFAVVLILIGVLWVLKKAFPDKREKKS